MRILLLLLMSALSGLHHNLFAQQPLTLQEALARALRQNPEVIALSRELNATTADIAQAGTLPNPEVNVEIENFGGSSEFDAFNRTESSFELNQLLELGGKRGKRKEVATFGRAIAEMDYQAKRLEIESEVMKAFTDVLASQARLHLATELQKLAAQVADTVREKVNAGEVSGVEEMRANIALHGSQVEMEQSRLRLNAARRRLASTWGDVTPSFDMVRGDLAIAGTLIPIETFTGRVDTNPAVARWDNVLQQRQALFGLERARAIPDVIIGGGLRRLNEFDESAYTVNFSVPLPIFNRNQGARQAASLRVDSAQQERNAAEIRVVTALTASYQSLAAAHAHAVALRERILPNAESAYSAIQEGYREGKFGLLDVLDAQRTLFAARQQFVEAQAEYHRSMADIHRWSGQSALNQTPGVEP